MPGIDSGSLFVNSLFESASGFTTTGLSMITQPENLPQSFNFYRAYTQWVGGLSFVYLVMILFFPEEKLSAWKSVLFPAFGSPTMPTSRATSPRRCPADSAATGGPSR